MSIQREQSPVSFCPAILHVQIWLRSAIMIWMDTTSMCQAFYSRIGPSQCHRRNPFKEKERNELFDERCRSMDARITNVHQRALTSTLMTYRRVTKIPEMRLTGTIQTELPLLTIKWVWISASSSPTGNTRTNGLDIHSKGFSQI